jgi:uncharacterized protein HemX
MSDQDKSQQQDPIDTALDAMEQDLAKTEALEPQSKGEGNSEASFSTDDFDQAGDKQVVQPVVVKKSGGVVAWIAMLFSLICMAALGGAYWYWNQHQLLQQQQELQWRTEQSSHLKEMEQQIQLQLTQQLASTESALKTQQQQALATVKNEVIERVSTMDSKVSEVTGRRPNDWTLAEANYLIRIAGRKLWLEHDRDTAMTLLATADVRISELSDPSLFPLRKMISQDIAALGALPNPRLTDFHLALSGAITTVDTLPINMIEMEPEAKENVDISASETPAGWKDNLLKSLSGLKTMIAIRHSTADGIIEPLMLPKQQWYLRANVKMAMLQAQVAVLKRDQKVYNDAVSRAKQWLQYFKQTDAGVHSVLLTLTALQDKTVRVAYPEQFASQKMLDKLISDRLGSAYQAPVTVTPPSEDQAKAGEL